MNKEQLYKDKKERYGVSTSLMMIFAILGGFVGQFISWGWAACIWIMGVYVLLGSITWRTWFLQEVARLK